MALDDLLAKLKNSESNSQEVFLALEISKDIVKSATWLVENQQTKVLKIGDLSDWQEDDKQSLLKAVDTAISSLTEGENLILTKVLFGLPEDWVEKQEILPKYKQLLHFICQKLELKPIGFVVTNEALVEYFKQQQGPPPSCVLIKVGEDQLEVSLAVLGKITSTEMVGRTEDFVADVKEGLARFEVDNLPARIVLYDGLIDFEEVKQQLLSYNWQDDLPFLHFPKIESLGREVSVKSIAIAGGMEAAKSLGIEILDKKETTEVNDSQETEKKETVLTSQASTQMTTKSLEKFSKTDFKDEKTEIDLTKKAVKPILAEENNQEQADVQKLTSLGFVKNRDILKGARIRLDKDSEVEKKISPEKKVVENNDNLKISQKQAKKLKDKLIYPLLFIKKLLTNFLSGFKGKIKKPNYQISFGFFSRRLGFWLALIVFIFVALFAGALAFYWYVPRAEVVIYVSPKIIEKDLQLEVSTKAQELDLEKNIIPAENQEIELVGSLSQTTTGTKLVGDKASGKVTILNKTDSQKAFSQGAVLVGGNNLRFEIDDEVKVASRSTQVSDDDVITITPGKAQVAVVAASIGQEYNLKKGEEFSFKDYDSDKFSAKASEAFSGGSSREIQAVSKEDQETLLKNLTDKLKNEAEQKLKEKIGSQQTVLKETFAVEVLNKSFDKEVGDEGDSLNLELKLKLAGLSFSQNDLKMLATASLNSLTQDDFTYDKNNLEIEIVNAVVNDGKTDLNLIAKTKLLPNYDKAELLNNLVGKYPQLVQGYLSTLSDFVKADIKVIPKLPGKLGTLPRSKSKIDIKIEPIDQ